MDGHFTGYASLFGVPDLGRDVVAPGAFAASLAARGVAGVRMLWQHDPAEPVGRWLALREDARGLRVRGPLNLAVQRARELDALLRRGRASTGSPSASARCGRGPSAAACAGSRRSTCGRSRSSPSRCRRARGSRPRSKPARRASRGAGQPRTLAQDIRALARRMAPPRRAAPPPPGPGPGPPPSCPPAPRGSHDRSRPVETHAAARTHRGEGRPAAPGGQGRGPVRTPPNDPAVAAAMAELVPRLRGVQGDQRRAARPRSRAAPPATC